MIIIILLFSILVLLNVRFTSFNKDYISRDTTKYINGIFVFLIIVSHFVGYIDLNTPLDTGYSQLKAYLGQCVVATFLFFSGFGLLEAIQKRGYSFIKSLPKRTLQLLIHLDCAIVIFLLYGMIMGRNFTMQDKLLAFIGWANVGNSNWYIFVIMVLYIFTFICFILPYQNNYIKVLLLFALSIGLVLILRDLRGKETWWYNTILCFNAGTFFSLFKSNITEFLKNNFAFILTLLTLVFLFIVFKEKRSRLFYYELHAIIFCLIIITLSSRFTIQSKVLNFLGDHIFSIYILQRIPMNFASRITFFQNNKFIFFTFALVATLTLSYIFDRLMIKIDKFIFDQKNVSQE